MSAAFLSFATEQGVFINPESLTADGRIHRAHAGLSSADKNDATYLLRADGSGWVNNFKGDGVPVYFKPERTQPLTPEQSAALAAKYEADRQARKQELQAQRDAAIEFSHAAWEASTVPMNHGYLALKDGRSLDATGLREFEGRLLVPMQITHVEHKWVLNLTGVQGIDSTGEKRFAQGMQTKGAFAFFPLPITPDSTANEPLHLNIAVSEAAVKLFTADKVVFCEGAGTALAIHQATGLPVVAALSAQNLPIVAQSLADRFQNPNIEIIIYADNDGEKLDFKGQRYALEAAKILDARIVLPEHPSGETPDGYDARDLLRDANAAAVSRAIDSAQTAANFDPELRFTKLEQHFPLDFLVQFNGDIQPPLWNLSLADFSKKMKVEPFAQDSFSIVSPSSKIRLDASVNATTREAALLEIYNELRDGAIRHDLLNDPIAEIKLPISKTEFEKLDLDYVQTRRFCDVHGAYPAWIGDGPPSFSSEKGSLYVKTHGEFAFRNPTEAANYAKSLELGEGGRWAAEKITYGTNVEWRAVRHNEHGVSLGNKALAVTTAKEVVFQAAVENNDFDGGLEESQTVQIEDGNKDIAHADPIKALDDNERGMSAEPPAPVSRVTNTEDLTLAKKITSHMAGEAGLARLVCNYPHVGFAALLNAGSLYLTEGDVAILSSPSVALMDAQTAELNPAGEAALASIRKRNATNLQALQQTLQKQQTTTVQAAHQHGVRGVGAEQRAAAKEHIKEISKALVMPWRPRPLRPREPELTLG